MLDNECASPKEMHFRFHQNHFRVGGHLELSLPGQQPFYVDLFYVVILPCSFSCPAWFDPVCSLLPILACSLTKLPGLCLFLVTVSACPVSLCTGLLDCLYSVFCLPCIAMFACVLDYCTVYYSVSCLLCIALFACVLDYWTVLMTLVWWTLVWWTLALHHSAHWGIRLLDCLWHWCNVYSA